MISVYSVLTTRMCQHSKSQGDMSTPKWSVASRKHGFLAVHVVLCQEYIRDKSVQLRIFSYITTFFKMT